MTTISLGSAFEGMGNANSGYRSKTFEKFVNSLAGFRDRVEAQYAGTVYPTGSASLMLPARRSTSIAAMS